MAVCLCTEHFQEFYLALCQNVQSLEDFLTSVQQNVYLIAKDILLGHLEASFSAKPSVYEPNGFFFTGVGYTAEEGFEADFYEEEYSTEANGFVKIRANPQKDCTWSDEDKKSIHFFFALLFMVASRTRLSDFMRKVEDSDALTGALNSHGLQKKIVGILKQGRGAEYASIFSNIRNFKYINSQLGQANGDLILRMYCMQNASFLGENGFFCRLGGDNFMALVHKSVLEQYLAFTRLIHIPVGHKGKTMQVAISAKQGIYEITPQSTMSDIMGNPSVALYAAKASRSLNVMRFKPEMLAKTLHDKGISNSFPEALANGEFLVYYQPKVNLQTNTLCGCEALTRWKHNELIAPQDFILVLEHEGSIRNLDFYMLEGVCRDLRSWLDKGIEPVRVSTNFSKVHLNNEHFEQNIIDMLKKYNIPARYLEVELTELSDYTYYERLISFVKTIHNYGIHISIDDFGTGYSSMKLLKDLEADVIKLDKSLIDNIKLSVGGANTNADEIVSRAIINMAKELHIDVIAEGVETIYQADFLRRNGCSMAQGFLFDRPLPQDQFEKLLTGSRVYTIEKNADTEGEATSVAQ